MIIMSIKVNLDLRISYDFTADIKLCRVAYAWFLVFAGKTYVVFFYINFRW